MRLYPKHPFRESFQRCVTKFVKKIIRIVLISAALLIIVTVISLGMLWAIRSERNVFVAICFIVAIVVLIARE